MKLTSLLIICTLLLVSGTLAVKLTDFTLEYTVQASHTDLVLKFDEEVAKDQEIVFGTKDKGCLLFDDKLEVENFISHDDSLCYLENEIPTIMGRVVAIEKEVDTVHGCKNKFAKDETVGTSFKFVPLTIVPKNAKIRCKTKIAIHANFEGPIYVALADEKPVKTEFSPKVEELSFVPHLSNKKSHFELKFKTNSFGSHPFELSCEKYKIPCHLSTENIYCNNRLGRLFSRQEDDGTRYNFVYAAAVNRDIICQFHLDDYYPTVDEGAEVPQFSLVFPELPDKKKQSEKVSYSLDFDGARVFHYYNEAKDGKSTVADVYFEVPNHSREMKVGSEYEWIIDEDFLDLLDFPEKKDGDDKIRYYSPKSSLSYEDQFSDPLPSLPVDEFIFERISKPPGLKMIFNGKADELIDDPIVRGRIPFKPTKLSTFSEATIKLQYSKHNGKPVSKTEIQKNTFSIDLRGYLHIKDSTAEINRDKDIITFSTTVEAATMNIDAKWYIGYRFDTFIPSLVEKGLSCTVHLRGKSYSNKVSNRLGDFYISSDLNIKYGETVEIKCEAPFPSDFTKMDMTITTVSGVLGHKYIKSVGGFTPQQLVPTKKIQIQQDTKHAPAKLSKLVINYPAYIDDERSTVLDKLEEILVEMKGHIGSDSKPIYKNLEWENLYFASLTIDDMYEDRSVISPFESHFSWLSRTTAMGFHAEIYIDQQLTADNIKDIQSYNIDPKEYVTPHILDVDYFTVDASLPAEADTRCRGRSSIGSYNCMKLYPGQGCTFNAQCQNGECIKRACHGNSFNLPSSSSVVFTTSTIMFVAFFAIIAVILG